MATLALDSGFPLATGASESTSTSIVSAGFNTDGPGRWLVAVAAINKASSAVGALTISDNGAGTIGTWEQMVDVASTGGTAGVIHITIWRAFVANQLTGGTTQVTVSGWTSEAGFRVLSLYASRASAIPGASGTTAASGSMAATLTSKAPGSYIVGAWGGWNSSALPFSLQADVTEDGSEQNSTTSTSRGCAGHYAPSSFPNQTITVGATDSDAQATAAVYEILVAEDTIDTATFSDAMTYGIPTQTTFQSDAFQADAFQIYGGAAGGGGPTGSSITETATFKDTLDTKQADTDGFTDTAKLSDTQSSAQKGTGSFTETANFSDTQGAAQKGAASFSETAAFSDTQGSVQRAISSFGNTATFADVMDSTISSSGGTGYSGEVAETVAMGDAMDCALAMAAALSETQKLSDSQAASLIIGAALQEVTTFSDSLASRQSMGAAIAETVRMSDALERSGGSPLPSGKRTLPSVRPWWRRHYKFTPHGGTLW